MFVEKGDGIDNGALTIVDIVNKFRKFYKLCELILANGFLPHIEENHTSRAFEFFEYFPHERMRNHGTPACTIFNADPLIFFWNDFYLKAGWMKLVLFYLTSWMWTAFQPFILDHPIECPSDCFFVVWESI